jgi:transketolase
MSQRDYLESTSELSRLELIATRIRKNALEYITNSGSGHPGGSVSIADIMTVLYFGHIFHSYSGEWERIMSYDPADPFWSNRDRFVLSKGHAAPAFYAVLAEAGFFSPEHFKIYRKIDCLLEGHPVMCRLFKEDGQSKKFGIEGVDFPSGSLGHGLAAACGMALHAKVYGYSYSVYAMLGDGDLQEGMTWEACLTGGNKKLNNLCAFVDYNRLQVDGSVDTINPLDPLRAKFEAFNWDVREINGHDYSQIIDTLYYFKTSRDKTDKPLMVIAHTVKGKGVKEIENDYVYHAVPLNPEQYERAEKEFDARIELLEKQVGAAEGVTVMPLEKTNPPENKQDLPTIIHNNPMQAYSEPTATRIGYGNALARLGEYEKLFVLNADLAGACGTTKFIQTYPENAPEAINRRSINVGVQECNMMTMGAALASCGKIPIVNSFGVFSTGRAWEMVRQDISYPKLNVKIIGSHTGIALGEYGVTHQSVADVAVMRVLPHLTIVEPSDAIQADLLFEQIIQHEGPLYLRLGRNPTPLIYGKGNEWGIKPIREFELGKGYVLKEGADITLICSGPITCQALEVAQQVKESVRVIDMPTIRPVDAEIIEQAARETQLICTVQDHLENGGLSGAVGKVILKRGLKVKFDYVALSGFAESGSPADLYEKYGLSANCIIRKLGLTELKGISNA